MKAFLEFCYTGKYTFAGLDVTPALDFELYQLADYVLASTVKTYAAKVMNARHLNLPENAGFLPGLVKAVYENTDGNQHADVREVLVDSVVRAFGIKGVGVLRPLLDIVKDYGEFSTAVLEKTLKWEMRGFER